MEDNTPKFVPKFSFNPFKRMFWIIKHNFAPGIQSILQLWPYLVLFVYWSYIDSFVKCLHIFISSLLGYLTKLFVKP